VVDFRKSCNNGKGYVTFQSAGLWFSNFCVHSTCQNVRMEQWICLHRCFELILISYVITVQMYILFGVPLVHYLVAH